MEQLIIKTKISIKAIIFGIVGILFFGGLINLILHPKWNVADETNANLSIIIKWIFFAFFSFFQIYTLLIILKLKTIILTNKNLIIKKPFLFQSKKISIENIKKISEKPIKMNIGTSYEVFGDTDIVTIYKGKQIKLEFYEGKTLKLNSIEIPEYELLKTNLKKQIRKNRGLLGHFENFNESKYLLILYLIIIVFITFGLIYSQINNGI